MENSTLKKYQEAYYQIEKQLEIKEKKELKKNLILFLVIIPILISFDFFDKSEHFHWSLLPLFGWGSGLIAWYYTLPRVDQTLPKKVEQAEKQSGIVK